MVSAQVDTTSFSNALRIKFKKYQTIAEHAYRTGDAERGDYLFDSLVQYRLRSTTFDDYTFKKVNGGKLELSKIKKPIVLITFSSSMVTGLGEIPAINKLAHKYRKDVQYVALFWDRRHNMKKIAAKFNSNVIVCYAHESYKNDAPIVATMKHKIGYLASYYLDENRKVIDIKRCFVKAPIKKNQYQRGFALYYNNYLKQLHGLIVNFELKKEMLAVK
ncbi:hypothetical protein ACLI1A_06660 [Flavobacterium sp. RHBU_3]|uniref:hypothetical protein n=1 Tax=Flavobacterium sp. RHBU_3 TaxID=3391184 RepID=UPI003984D6B7